MRTVPLMRDHLLWKTNSYRTLPNIFMTNDLSLVRPCWWHVVRSWKFSVGEIFFPTSDILSDVEMCHVWHFYVTSDKFVRRRNVPCLTFCSISDILISCSRIYILIEFGWRIVSISFETTAQIFTRVVSIKSSRSYAARDNYFAAPLWAKTPISFKNEKLWAVEKKNIWEIFYNGDSWKKIHYHPCYFHTFCYESSGWCEKTLKILAPDGCILDVMNWWWVIKRPSN